MNTSFTMLRLFRARNASQLRVTPFLRCASTSSAAIKAERQRKLSEVYARFEGLEPNSSEYHELARSGRVWEDYFQPWDSEKLGYISLQKANKGLLESIDGYRDAISIPVDQLSKTLVAEYAHQSVSLEGNRLKLGDSIVIADKLTDTVFDHVEAATMPVEDLLKLSLPQIAFDDYEASEVAELTNHVVASFWIAENATRALGTAGLSETEIRHLSNLTNRGTASAELYTKGWGKRISLGDYRATPIQSSSNPLRIYPYHVEVPALMKRFVDWRNRMHREKQLHPLIAACQVLAYFLHIHPFPDGNGRVGRMIMHDYMVRQGYSPVVMQELEREDYLRMVSDAQDGKPEELVLGILMTQYAELRTFKDREISDSL